MTVSAGAGQKTDPRADLELFDRIKKDLEEQRREHDRLSEILEKENEKRIREAELIKQRMEREKQELRDYINEDNQVG